MKYDTQQLKQDIEKLVKAMHHNLENGASVCVGCYIKKINERIDKTFQKDLEKE